MLQYSSSTNVRGAFKQSSKCPRISLRRVTVRAAEMPDAMKAQMEQAMKVCPGCKCAYTHYTHVCACVLTADGKAAASTMTHGDSNSKFCACAGPLQDPAMAAKMKEMQEAMSRPEVQQQMAEMQVGRRSRWQWGRSTKRPAG
jgi:hypothetical protein